MRCYRCGRSPRRAFTLIELMIVVVIIGVLSSLAIYSVTQYIRHTKTAEAREIIGSIMAGQHAYHGEVGRFLNVTGSATNFYPVDTTFPFDGSNAIMWGAVDGCMVGATPCIDNFNSIGVNVGFAVLFRYASTTMEAGEVPPLGGRAAGYNPSNVTSPRHGFVAIAASNLDEKDDAVQTVLVGSSMQTHIYSENIGE